MSYKEIATGFSQGFYQAFAGGAENLRGVYRATSLLTWAGEEVQGVDAIVAHIASKNLGAMKTHVDEVDAQPTTGSTILVIINGQLLLEGQEHSLKFVDTFNLAADDAGWYIANHIFRIIGGGD